MEVVWNPREEQYTPILNRVFDSCRDLLPEMEASISSQSNQGNFLFRSEGRDIAFVSTYCSTWHPYCIYVRFACERSTEYPAHIKEVIMYIKEVFQKPLFFLLDDRFSVLQSILEQTGFQMIRKTEIVRFKPAISISERSSNLKSVLEIKGVVPLETSLVKLCKRLYTETHLDNPVAELSDETWRSAIFDGLLEKYSFLAERDGSIVGFSLVYEGCQPGWELGWVGVDNSARMHLLEWMLDEQLGFAFEERVPFIEKEIDSTCPYSLHLKQTTSYEVMETLYSYRST
ncbi:hypothetical protein HNO89_003418 [Sporosarcina luteola]|nr:hypothetical protein [Sporosarcina luteola]